MNADSTKRPVRVGIISLGCAKNLVDAEIMLGTLLRDGVEVTNDHAHAKVFYTSLDGDSPVLQQGLERASGFLRSQLAHAMKLRITPQLHFVYDASIERGAHERRLRRCRAATERTT